jgi:hypothetical protein
MVWLGGKGTTTITVKYPSDAFSLIENQKKLSKDLIYFLCFLNHEKRPKE